MIRSATFFIILLIASSFAIQQEYCDVIIAGGSTAAVAAAISSAQQKVSTCLLEPTDWPGGQITSSAVPAIDWAWDSVTDKKTGFVLDKSKASHDPANIPPLFYNILHNLTQTGQCWVSTNCFFPTDFLQTGLFPTIQELSPYLKVFYSTVVKSVETTDTQITSIYAIQRTPLETTKCNGYDIFASQDMPDWYSEENSKRYSKQIIEFSSGKSSAAIFMDATEYGDVLATSQAPYLQGIDERYDGDVSGIGDDSCGQSITVDFVQSYHANVTNEPANPYPVEYPQHYTLRTFTWEDIWDYRRILSQKDASSHSTPEPGDFTIQNYVGNDFSYGYLFMSKHDAKESVLAGNWTGGINYENLYSAEKLAYGWHYWFKNKTNIANHITLDSSVLGTCHGLAKLPYLRDTRRSIGIDKFLMNLTDITGIAEQLIGTPFFDRVAMGSYDVDIHPLVGCNYPAYMHQYYPVLLYFIPLRALTNVKYENLLVAGKTMAQSFLVNAATRLHPVEWASGTGAGVVAGYMANNQLTSTADALKNVAEIQEIAQNFTPLSWTINGKKYPQ